MLRISQRQIPISFSIRSSSPSSSSMARCICRVLQMADQRRTTSDLTRALHTAPKPGASSDDVRAARSCSIVCIDVSRRILRCDDSAFSRLPNHSGATELDYICNVGIGRARSRRISCGDSPSMRAPSGTPTRLRRPARAGSDMEHIPRAYDRDKDAESRNLRDHYDV